MRLEETTTWNRSPMSVRVRVNEYDWGMLCRMMCDYIITLKTISGSCHTFLIWKSRQVRVRWISSSQWSVVVQIACYITGQTLESAVVARTAQPYVPGMPIGNTCVVVWSDSNNDAAICFDNFVCANIVRSGAVASDSANHVGLPIRRLESDTAMLVTDKELLETPL